MGPHCSTLNSYHQFLKMTVQCSNKYVYLLASCCTRFAHMLTGIKENHKFQKKRQEVEEEKEEDHHPSSGLEIVVREAKQNHGVK